MFSYNYTIEIFPRKKYFIIFRIIPTAVHTLEDVNYTLNAFADVKRKLAEGKYDSDEMPNMAIW